MGQVLGALRSVSSGLPARRVGALIAAAVLLSGPFARPHAAIAQCSAGEASCSEGSNETDIGVSHNNQGGDAVAGGQVIGSSGVSGNVDVTANNSSEFSSARGGDSKSKTKAEGHSGSASIVEGSVVNVTADATGTSSVSQTASPGVFGSDSIPATGESLLSGSVTSLDGSVTQDSTATSSPVATSIAAPAVLLPTVIHKGDNKVSLSSKGSAVSGDAVAGGQVIGVVAVTGETRVIATNRSVFATARSGDAVGNITLSGEAGPRLVGSGGSTEVSSGAHDSVSVSQTGSPNVSASTEGAGDADIEGEAPVTQEANVESRPTAIALAGQQTVGRTLVHEGDNEAEAEFDFEAIGGDAVAGGQVIGVSGVSGNVTIEANNTSRFATAKGGDAKTDSRADVRSGPRLEAEGGSTRVDAVAMGATEVVQTATPNVAIQATGSSTITSTAGTFVQGVNLATVTGSAPVVQSATALVAPTAVAVAGLSSSGELFDIGPTSDTAGSQADATVAANAQGTGGAFQTASPVVNLIVDQASRPSGTVSGDGAPVVTVVGSNAANVTGSAPVLQTALVVSRPSAAAILLDGS